MHVGVGFDEQVHRPVGLILIHAVQTGDGHVVETQSAAASFEVGSMARFATSANSTRSTSVVNRRPPRTVRSAVSTSRAFHSPCSSHAVPAGREEISRSPSEAVSVRITAAASVPASGSGSPR